MKRTILLLAGIATIVLLAPSAKSLVVKAQTQLTATPIATVVPQYITPQPVITPTNSTANNYGYESQHGRMGGGHMGGMMGRGYGMSQEHKESMGQMMQGMMSDVAGMIHGYMDRMNSGSSHSGTMMEQSSVHSDVAAMMGMTEQDLYNKMAAGMSLTQIAAEKGISEQQLVDAIMMGRRAAYSQAVEQGYMTQAQADTMLQNMQNGVMNMVNGQGLGAESWGRMWEWEYGMQPTQQPAP